MTDCLVTVRVPVLSLGYVVRKNAYRRSHIAYRNWIVVRCVRHTIYEIRGLLFFLLFSVFQNLVLAWHILVNKRFLFCAVEGYEGMATPWTVYPLFLGGFGVFAEEIAKIEKFPGHRLKSPFRIFVVPSRILLPRLILILLLWLFQWPWSYRGETLWAWNENCAAQDMFGLSDWILFEQEWKKVTKTMRKTWLVVVPGNNLYQSPTKDLGARQINDRRVWISLQIRRN